MTETSTKEKPSQSKESVNLDKDVRFKIGPPLIQTAEDAREAYLREEISLEEFEAARGRFGGLPLQRVSARIERGDEAFHRDLPDDYFDSDEGAVPSLEERLQLVENKEEVKEAATKASDEVLTEATITIPDDVVRNKAAHDAAEKVAEGQKEPSAEAIVAPEL